ncbi:MAG: glycosyltransferase [Candidatus Saccharibacteria bacterium]
MVTISLCMIVKNEEETLGRCLDSIKDLVDEIVIVDTGSTDRTKEIAERYSAKIHDFEWIDDFSAARNYSFSKATQDYILWLDADDVLFETDREKLKKLKETLDPRIDVVMMRYNLGVDDKGNVTTTYYRERLLKRSRNFKWHDPIHEYMLFSGNIINSDVAITHKKMRGRSSRNLDIFEKMISQGRELSHRNKFYYARELFHNRRFEEAIVYYHKFLDAEGGLMANYIDACIDLYSCYKQKDDEKSAYKALLRSFEHDIPHAEICCQLGYFHKKRQEYRKAVYWFAQAANIPKPESSWGSIIPDCYDYIPSMELCSCNYRLGNAGEALKHARKAAEYKPGDPLALQNIEFLSESLNLNPTT